MKKPTHRMVSIIIIMILMLTLLSGCDPVVQNDTEPAEIASIKDIPNITPEEIAAIEALKEHTDTLVFGMMLSTEAFEDQYGEVGGFAALFCDWLTGIFDITFQTRIYDWPDLWDGLNTGEIAFTGELTRTKERLETLHMTPSIVSRPFSYIRFPGSTPLSEISKSRPLRLAFFDGATTLDIVSPVIEEDFEVIAVNSFSSAYDALYTGRADAFVAENTTIAAFDGYGEVILKEFSPLLYTSVSVTAKNPAFRPVISVIEKALACEEVRRHLAEMYNTGYHEYLRHELFNSLTDEERLFIRENPRILIAAESYNYPLSFYNFREEHWQGITFDVLREVEALTGLEFIRVNDERTNISDLLKMLENDEVSLITDLMHTEQRENNFLWTDSSLLTARSALISKPDFRDVTLNDIMHMKIGLVSGYAHTEYFHSWFPDHQNNYEFQNMMEAFDALDQGDVDAVMAGDISLLILTHYMERPGYKICYLFDNPYSSSFGLNINEGTLQSILNKALRFVDTYAITEQWRYRTYDYRSSIAEARMPWVLGAGALSLCVLILVAILLIRSRRTGRRLEDLVSDRTHELEMQTSLLLTILDASPDYIYCKDLDLHYTRCNLITADFLGTNSRDVIGKTDADLFPLTIAEGFINDDKKIIDEKRPMMFEKYITPPSGKGGEIYLETIKAPLMKDGEVFGVLGISRDISKRKEMEHKLACRYEYANKLGDVLSQITKSPNISTGDLKAVADIIAEEGCHALNTHRVGVWKVSDDFSVLENSSCFSITTGKHYIHEDFDLLGRPKYSYLIRSRRLIVTNDINDSLYDVDRDGHAPDMCAMIDAPIRIEGKLVGVICAEQDRCEEYQDKREWLIEEQNFVSSLADLMALAISNFERRKARDAAETANRSKSAFLANMSHEIRTPMNAIMGITDILLNGGDLPKDVTDGLNKIYTSSDMLLGIINDILDFSKVEAGKLDIMHNEYNLASLIHDSSNLNMMRIGEKPIEFVLQIDENVPAKLIGDELRIKQILNNVLSNAFKYTGSGRVVLSIVAEKEPGKDEFTLIFGVQDTGMGMNKDQLGMLFDEYSRFNESKCSIEGTGLGLSITLQLIKLMNGTIHVESEQGKGSLFTISLPQGFVDNEVLGKDAVENLRKFHQNDEEQMKPKKLVRTPMPYGRVLIVDDNETNLFVAVRLMKFYKLWIDTTINGIEAINKIKNGKEYDIIFMDHMMPEMDGITATKHLRDYGYTGTIVALTANAVSGQADVFLNSGFDAFLSKPIDIHQLDTILNKYIYNKYLSEIDHNTLPQIEMLPNDSTRMNDRTVLNEYDDRDIPQTNDYLCNAFIRDAQKTITTLIKLINESGYEDEESLETYITTVHGIKGALGAIGETALSETAYSLEIAGKEKKIEYISGTTPAFIKKLNSFVKTLKQNNPNNYRPAV